jgi:hypothetical protein
VEGKGAGYSVPVSPHQYREHPPGRHTECDKVSPENNPVTALQEDTRKAEQNDTRPTNTFHWKPPVKEKDYKHKYERLPEHDVKEFCKKAIHAEGREEHVGMLRDGSIRGKII